jgi:hypothetical protein
VARREPILDTLLVGCQVSTYRELMPRGRRPRQATHNLDVMSAVAGRVARHLQRGLGPDGSCMVWTGPRHRSGVPRVNVGSTTTSVARAMFWLLHGRLPKGPIFRACPTSGCVSPACQSLARPAKPRRRRTLVPDDTVRAIRAQYAAGSRLEVLARVYGVSFSTACRLAKRVSRADVADFPPVEPDHGAGETVSAHTGAS